MDHGTERLLPLLICPTCHAPSLGPSPAGLSCAACGADYAISAGRPVLLRADNQLFVPDAYRALPAPTPPARGGLRRFVPEPSINLAVDRSIDRLNALLPPKGRVLVVGAGTQRSWLAARLGPQRTVIYCDIDVRADVDLFCDAHDLPFADASFDAVITTAVLEHVLYPERVAGEIARVVRPGGLLYSELPFMQQVHEGAYDFTRYTLSGHRRLFNRFAPIESGMVAGPGTALVWAIENFAAAFPAQPRARLVLRAAIRILFGWLKYFDRLFEQRSQAMDGASCTYLLARRSEPPTPDRDIIADYVGGRPLSHG